MQNVKPVPETPEFQLVLKELRSLNHTYGLTVSLMMSPSSRSSYRGSSDQIVLGLPQNNRDSLLMSFVHEYAHALNQSRKGMNHDKSFYRSLCDVARFVLGSEDRYAWDAEYAKIQKLAHRDGLSKKAPKMFANRMGCLELDEGWLSGPCWTCSESTCLRFPK